MANNSAFYNYHPAVNFCYFAGVIATTIMHPAFLVIGFSASLAYAIILMGKGLVKSGFLFMVPMFLVVAVINPLFNHSGATVLFYLNDNPVTFEAAVYGLASAVMLMTVILWFQCCGEIMSSDKFIYLFGKFTPYTALLLSMTLRLIPRLSKQIKTISQSQKLIGKDISTGNVFTRAKNGIGIISILASWALENSIETAASMKARGYGSHKRSSFSLFHFQRRDFYFLVLIFTCVITVITLNIFGYSSFTYYPNLQFPNISAGFLLALSSYGILCITPVAMEIYEVIKWRSLKLKISASHTRPTAQTARMEQ